MVLLETGDWKNYTIICLFPNIFLSNLCRDLSDTRDNDILFSVSKSCRLRPWCSSRSYRREPGRHVPSQYWANLLTSWSGYRTLGQWPNCPTSLGAGSDLPWSYCLWWLMFWRPKPGECEGSRRCLEKLYLAPGVRPLPGFLSSYWLSYGATASEWRMGGGWRG